MKVQNTYQNLNLLNLNIQNIQDMDDYCLEEKSDWSSNGM
jgi:hypothetical protein